MPWIEYGGRDRMQSASIHFVSALSSALVFMMALGCARNLTPASSQQLLDVTATPAEQSGVRVAVVPGRWSGVPENLPELATPLYVRIQNNGKRALRLRYDAFELTGANGTVLTAQAPYNLEIDGAVVKPVLLPQNYLGPQPGFTPAPHYRTRDHRRFLPRHPWNYDEYTPQYNLWAYPLPTQDMLTKGIPEGVLDPGGNTAGFLYFSRLPEDARRVAFEMQLVDASTGNVFGEIRIPVRVR
jgi:hypothetical protein